MAKLALQTSNTFSYTFAPVAGGTGYIVAANNNPIFNIGGESWTIECWIKPTGTYAAEYGLFGRRQGTTTAASYYGYLTATSGFISYYNGTAYTSSARVTPNVWNHVAYVFNNGANLRIFLNGSNVLTTTAVTSVTNVDATLSVGSAIGGFQYYGDISNFRIVKGQALYTGNFDVSAFPVQLPNNAIGSHVGATNVAASLTGNVIFLTCNDQYLKTNGNTAPLNTFTIYGDVVPHAVDTKELQNFSYFFPANNSGNATVLATSVTNSLNLNADFTIEMWYYPTSNSGVILERGLGGVTNNTASYVLAWDRNNNNINFAVANANNTTYCLGSITGATGSLGSPTINAWNHIAITRATNTWRGFLNGSLNLNVATNSNTPYFAQGRGLTIGGAWANGSAYSANVPSNTINGYISNLRVIRGNSVYNAAFTPANTQLPNVTNTILLTGLTNTFEDLVGQHTLATNGMSEISISTFSPFKANSVANANAANVSFGTAAQGIEQPRIYNKFDYANFGQVVDIYPAQGIEQPRIYNKFDYANFGQVVNIYPAQGVEQRRISNIYSWSGTRQSIF
jgi:Concanavalin A-like lectin/glucanases superfamily